MQEIHVDDIGSGFPLVLIHGYLGSSEMWTLQKQFLSKNFRIISPALPGFGESYKVKSLNTIKEMAKTIFKCLDEKNINKLICFATGSIGDIPGRFESLDKSIERLKKEGIKKTVKRIPPKWFVEGNRAKYYYFCENAVKKITEETAINALNAMKNWNGYDNLKNIKNETLIIWGDKDVSYNFEQVDTLNKNIPKSRIEIFKGCCHNVHLEQPQKFNETVKNFLE